MNKYVLLLGLKFKIKTVKNNDGFSDASLTDYCCSNRYRGKQKLHNTYNNILYYITAVLHFLDDCYTAFFPPTNYFRLQ